MFTDIFSDVSSLVESENVMKFSSFSSYFFLPFFSFCYFIEKISRHFSELLSSLIGLLPVINSSLVNYITEYNY